MTGVAGASSRYGILRVLRMRDESVEVEFVRSNKSRLNSMFQKATFSEDRGASREEVSRIVTGDWFVSTFRVLDGRLLGARGG
jgi:hypothetical protein